jgi:HK97 family phage major capsid protein
MARVIDKAAMFGSGTPPEPGGISTTAGILVEDSGTALTNTMLSSAYAKLVAANVMPTGLALSPVMDSQVRTERAIADGQWLGPPPGLEGLVNGRLVSSALITTGPIENGIMADWSRLLIGMRLALSVRVLSELYAATGEVGFMFFSRVDFALEWPQAFCRIYNAP